ncbi:3-(cis-5,6-dihydroxycyclohexa-1,3-dien-1-yl)propanoate dehydrogenase [Nocardia rhizosphaerihabitans]|uniref:3-phenylpropionate-dihydrodiol/cinnamic acid-dihydrodiol dehydrogenase n=1 Tax=Nocardia rhizosphaerihabitans TaxID=1691570 RepID=A0ABQ2L1X5_9NOCA|nr:3-(cis-5,6-dihydroxycyclohexa-1,3-dien-1-yl)propanoate dehydrogenase [Nocardia rhizosphaerihabitans]GGN99907.1 3-phenylpropionate-dihydrodiol/cinnamic acid-dihydrodiol dehydrogenase [Nocardia rhizosphaerihabitans]
MSEGWLTGKVVLITGGGTGIGRAVVERFVEEGARVGVLDRSDEAVAELRALPGGNVWATGGDVRSLDDHKRAVADTVERFGKLDVLVTVAGIFDYFVSLESLAEDRIDAAFSEMFDINVKGSLLAVKAALPELSKTQGNVVLTISNAGFLPGGGGPLYTGSKFAVRGLLSQLSFELAPNIRVNAVAPGGTVTQLRGLEAMDSGDIRLADMADLPELIRQTNPLQVASQPTDHAWAYVYLASKERTTSVTGCVIHSDGGLHSRGLVPLGGELTS